jgi:hypothetical protein
VGKELSRSKALLVLCSPAARSSYYVNQEISLWLERFSDRPILPVILQAKAPSEHPEECFPQALIEKPLHRAAIWYDLRAMRARSQDEASSSRFRDPDDELVRLAGDLLDGMRPRRAFSQPSGNANSCVKNVGRRGWLLPLRRFSSRSRCSRFTPALRIG